MKFIDLFCGCGGFSEGLRQAGHESILGVDIDTLACETYRLNHNCKVTCQDILEPFEIPFVDLIIGSPPCPDFSEANRNFKKNNREPDLRYVKRFLHLVDLQKPKYWIMENVLSVLDYFPKLKPKTQILCANEFGLYHKRKRAFIGDFPLVTKKKKKHILYPTPISCDDHIHKSQNNPKVSCLSDYFGFTPDISIFKKVMGFSQDYLFVGKKDQKEQIKQIGNAVCPPVAKAIGESLK